MSKAILWCSYLLHQLRLLLIKCVKFLQDRNCHYFCLHANWADVSFKSNIFSSYLFETLDVWSKKWLIVANRKPQEKKLSWISLRTCQMTFLLVCTSQSYSPAKNLAKTLQSVQITASWEKFLPALLLNWETFWKMLKSECTNLAYVCSGTMQHPQLKQVVLVQRLQ